MSGYVERRETGLLFTTNDIKCAITVSSSIIRYILDRAEQPYIQIRAGLRLQIIPNFQALSYCQRGQSAAFVASHQMLVVWQDDPKLLVQHAQYLQDALAKSIVGDEFDDEDKTAFGKNPASDAAKDDDSLGKGVDDNEERRETKIWQAGYTGVTVLALVTALGTGWRQVAIQQVQEPNLLRLLFIVTLPAQAWLALVSYQATGSSLGVLTLIVLLPSPGRKLCSNFWAHGRTG